MAGSPAQFLRGTFAVDQLLQDSLTHLWGSRRFATRDRSRNNWLVALLTFGEGLAQQSSRLSDFGTTWASVVRGRHEPVRDSSVQLVGLAKSVRAADLKITGFTSVR
jgi:stearoyl-CoA desaturase (delta-9 desaturase)